MGRILTGLALCGSWGCFDEFNRLQEATLSAVSMLLQPLQAAIKNKDPELELQGQKVKLCIRLCYSQTNQPDKLKK